jgi:thymidylate synthase (FAD)
MDKHFRVVTLASTDEPQTLVWKAMHQCYFEGFVGNCTYPPTEADAGARVIKHLLKGNRGHYGCYSSDTEVMTQRGWVAWPDVSPSDNLLAVDIETGLAHFEVPRALQSYTVPQGDYLYTIASQRVSLSVTADHRMVVSARTKQGWTPWQFRTAADIVGKAVRYLSATQLSDSDRKLPSDLPQGVDLINLFKLAGFFYGDGVRSQAKPPASLRFRLKKLHKIAYLHSLGMPVALCKGDRFTIRHAEVAAWIHKYFSYDSGKTLPNFILTLPATLFHALLDGLKHSDGTCKGATWALDSCEKVALDLLQAAAHLNQMSTSLTLNNPNEGEGHANHRACWRLHFNNQGNTPRFEPAQTGRTRGSESVVEYNGIVYCASVSTGALLVRHNRKVMVSGNCLEHPQITFAVGGFPHSVMQQARTHRVGVSFDVQSGRYTGKRVLKLFTSGRPSYPELEEVFYIRPEGDYTDRQGKKYTFYEVDRQRYLDATLASAEAFNRFITHGHAEEHARELLPYSVRQNFVVSFNLRSLMHFLDLRAKLDAQLEIRQLCDLLMIEFTRWTPDIAVWYLENRWAKARLAP